MLRIVVRTLGSTSVVLAPYQKCYSFKRKCGYRPQRQSLDMLPAKTTIHVLETTEMSSCNLCILKFDNHFCAAQKGTKINQFYFVTKGMKKV